ncbi:hypothetical protein TNCV_711901 [Trichonephila clavipes]|nr:hypothetical protein TNCV_711901 [Trichonephila clavipes]
MRLWAYGLKSALHPVSESLCWGSDDSGGFLSARYFVTIGGEDWSRRCALTWLLPDVLEHESFTWERAGWLLSEPQC